MKNSTVVNIFCEKNAVECITSKLQDLPVVCRSPSQLTRIQVMCYYAGLSKNSLTINFYDSIEMDYYYIELDLDVIKRVTIFSKEIAPDDFMN